MLDIFAFSQSVGRTPVSMELWNMMASDGASCFAYCFSILFGMLSGPDALDGYLSASYGKIYLRNRKRLMKSINKVLNA